MKAVLVIDMPDDSVLNECYAKVRVDRLKMDFDGVYGVGFNYVNTFTFVPLRPMPKRKIVLEHRVGGYTVNGIEMTQAYGYNECLDEILGETE